MTEQTIPGALAEQIARVSKLLEQSREVQRMGLPNVNMAPGIFLMEQSLKNAISAAGNADIVRQVRALEDLKGFSG